MNLLLHHTQRRGKFKCRSCNCCQSFSDSHCLEFTGTELNSSKFSSFDRDFSRRRGEILSRGGWMLSRVGKRRDLGRLEQLSLPRSSERGRERQPRGSLAAVGPSVEPSFHHSPPFAPTRGRGRREWGEIKRRGRKRRR